jgi:hypothetical protein
MFPFKKYRYSSRTFYTYLIISNLKQQLYETDPIIVLEYNIFSLLSTPLDTNEVHGEFKQHGGSVSGMLPISGLPLL